MLHLEQLPSELLCKPEPFIVLSGLDIDSNPVHRAIWRAFTTGRSRDRDLFKFRCFPIDHEFPKAKYKAPGSYEWYLPKGILKTGWMRKHLKQLPAVVAVFFDLDWDERLWDERAAECAQRVESVRLESEFRDMAINYYHLRAKRVKAHKDGLNKASHHLLFVRHEFKIAFFGELKQDNALALKHYQQAYTHLLEQRMVDIHVLEMKTIAGFINYKETIILLLEQAHLHYKRYKAERMKLHPCVLMGFEYDRKGNMTKALGCYSSVLGDFRREQWWSIHTFILQHMIKCSFLAGQIETFVASGLELLGPNSSLTREDKETVLLALFQIVQFQVPQPMPSWAQDVENATDAHKALWLNSFDAQRRCTTESPESEEANVTDTTLDSPITNDRQILLDVSQLSTCVECKVAFTKSRICIDEPIQLVVFFRSHAPLALQVRHVKVAFDHKIRTSDADSQRGRNEQSDQSWSTPFRLEPSNLGMAILFTLNTPNAGNKITVSSVSLELGSPSTVPETTEAVESLPIVLVWRWPAEEKQTRSNSISPPIAGFSVKPVAPTENEGTATFSALWDSSMVPSALESRIQSDATSLLDGSDDVAVLKHALPTLLPPSWELIGHQTQIEVLDRTCGLQVTLVHTSPAVTHEIYTVQCQIVNNEPIEVTKISLSVSLTDQPISREDDKAAPATQPTKSDSSIEIRSREPDQLRVNDLVGLQASISKPNAPRLPSTRSSVVSNSLDIPRLAAGETCSWPIHFYCPTAGQRVLRCHVTCATRFLKPIVPHCLYTSRSVDDKLSKTVTGHRLVQLDEALQRKAGEEMQLTSQTVNTVVTEIGVRPPFTLSNQTLSIQQSPVSELIVGEPFVLRLHLTNTSSWDLRVMDTSFTLAANVRFLDGKQASHITDVPVQPDGGFSDSQMLIVDEGCVGQDELLCLGQYRIRWRRQCESHQMDTVRDVMTEFQLPSCPLIELPIRLRADIPPTGTLLTPMPMSYVLENLTIYPQEIIIQLDGAPNFMFSGQQKQRMRLLPGSPQYLHHVILPLHAGHVTIPKLRIQMCKRNLSDADEGSAVKGLMDKHAYRQIPGRVFIVPAEKRIESNCTDAISQLVASG